ncbi:heterokaryon incompatibility protein-domain-containing protein, partial [Cercophora newfieldiana]
MATQSFTYKPLATLSEIRVLQVSPSLDSNAEISATFETESLAPTASPKFDALSYMWGDQTQRASISIDGAPFSVSRHLASTLCTLRDSKRPRRLWVDAICINQADSHERNQQVQLMKTVYQRADAVLIWLNQQVDASNSAIQKLWTIDTTSSIADLGDTPAFWKPLVDVFDDPYWGRVWIQQEI